VERARPPFSAAAPAGPSARGKPLSMLDAMERAEVPL
jgi:hypothetical protein